MSIHQTPNINLPTGPLVDSSGNVTIQWLLWLQNPRISTLQVQTLPGGSTPPSVGTVLVGQSASIGSAPTVVYAPMTAKELFQEDSPTVTGSKGGNAALANLVTALAGLGLIVDGTT